MDILYARSKATAVEVHEAMPNAPSLSAVRATLRILEEKGQIRHEEDGLRFVFLPAVEPARARKTALQHLIKTFFEGSPGNAMAALLDDSAGRLTGEELERLSSMIETARARRKK